MYIYIVRAMSLPATKFIPGLSNKPYSDRLHNLNLPTLKYRHYQCDMMELLK